MTPQTQTYDELKAELARLQSEVHDISGFARAVDPRARATTQQQALQRAYQKRLDAPKQPYRFSGKRIVLPDGMLTQESRPSEIAHRTQTFGRAIKQAIGGDRLRFDPADDPTLAPSDRLRTYHYGDLMHLSQRDYEALTRQGYVLVPLGQKDATVPDDDDHLSGAFAALEAGDYHEAVRILSAEHAMPRDEAGNVLRTKAEVLTALGQWVDDQRK